MLLNLMKIDLIRTQTQGLFACSWPHLGTLPTNCINDKVKRRHHFSGGVGALLEMSLECPALSYASRQKT